MIGCQEQYLSNPTERKVMSEQVHVTGGKQLSVDNPMGIRIVRFPAGRMVTSGPGIFGSDNFNRFEMFLARQPRDLIPREFLRDGSALGQLVWEYVLPPGTDEATLDTEGLAVVDFPGGLYAARVTRHKDADGTRFDPDDVYHAIIEWVTKAGYKANEAGCYGHIVTPDDTMAVLGYQQLELFVPITAE